MPKTQLGVRAAGAAGGPAGKRAADPDSGVGDRPATLAQDGDRGRQARAVDAAVRFLGDHQGIFDEAEHDQQTRRRYPL
ncbi:hypothetical protein AB0M86_42420 [Streptomyces sp. NPDC051639]|uniref:hypothetical protein n=1 Tax=Streptomyces sp. NPDC051639 TaxID=3155671 RepID=UPI00342C2DCC